MVNAAARRANKAQKNGDKDMTVTLDDLGIESLGEDYEFTRSGAGRKREPSPYDDVVEMLVGKGTQVKRVADEDEAKTVVKDLQKACEYRNRGLEKRIEVLDDGATAVVFRINAEKAKRAPRKPKAESGEAPSADSVDTAETD